MKATKILFYISSLIFIILLTSASIPVQTHVAGNLAWTNSLYELKKGDRLEIVSYNEITPLSNLTCTPSGVSNNMSLQQKYSVIKTANFGCLIGRIGEKGKPFVVGDKLDIIVESNGTLYLGINDTDLNENKGEFLCTVKITPIAVK